MRVIKINLFREYERLYIQRFNHQPKSETWKQKLPSSFLQSLAMNHYCGYNCPCGKSSLRIYHASVYNVQQCIMSSRGGMVQTEHKRSYQCRPDKLICDNIWQFLTFTIESSN
jgi:hypothetical protein